MIQYIITLILNDAEDKAFSEIALKAEKTKAEILDELCKDRIKSQISQWILDMVKTEIAKLDSAAALEKLQA